MRSPICWTSSISPTHRGRVLLRRPLRMLRRPSAIRACGKSKVTACMSATDSRGLSRSLPAFRRRSRSMPAGHPAVKTISPADHFDLSDEEGQGEIRGPASGVPTAKCRLTMDRPRRPPRSRLEVLAAQRRPLETT